MANSINETKALSRRCGIVFVCLAGLLLSGCMGAGLDLTSSDVDHSVATGSVPLKNNDSLSDALTVRNAVSSADVSKVEGGPIPWANSNSGSAGVISSINEEQVNGVTCRRFTTTRHSYQGIANFDGNTCLMQNGEWMLTSFAPRS
nr:RT0821/Lpp0805 family surface protein [Pararhizobium capsulatum]